MNFMAMFIDEDGTRLGEKEGEEPQFRPGGSDGRRCDISLYRILRKR